MKNNNLSILVLSCDKYSDIWNTYFDLFEKNWKECAYKVYLGSNTKTFDKKKVNVLFAGNDVDWSSTAKKIISQIDSPYILVLLEDILVASQVKNQTIESIIKFLNEYNVNFLQLQTRPGSKKQLTYEGIELFESPQKKPMKANVMGFWKKEYLLKLLLDGENPWNFERLGSYRASYDNGFYSLKNILFKQINLIEKGKWIYSSVRWCKKNNIALDFNKRKKLTFRDIISSTIKQIVHDFVEKLPWETRVKIIDFLKRLFISY